MQKHKYQFLLYAALLTVMAGKAYAQLTPPDIPSAADAGNLDKRLEQFKPELPKISGTSDIEAAAPATPAPKGAERITFTLQAINITGMRAYSAAEIEPLYADKLHRVITLYEVYQIANAITQRYARDGYVMSRAVVPPQDIKGGKVTLAVTEGYIGQVYPEGDYRETALTRQIINTITQMRPLNARDLEREMLLLNDTGVSAQAVLEPVSGHAALPGEAAMKLVFKAAPPKYTYNIDNFGTRYAGPVEGSVRASAYGVFNPYDTLTMYGFSTLKMNELGYGSGQYQIPLAANGLTLMLSAGVTKSHQDYRLKSYNLQSRAHVASAGLIYPVIRSRTQNLIASAMLEAKNIHSTILSTTLSEDRLRTIHGSISYNASDSWNGASSMGVDIIQGLDIFGATRTGSYNISRANGHSDFTKFEFNISRQQDMTKHMQLFASVIGQYALSPLLSSEQFGFGGQNFGRAYDSSEITGDTGIAASFELRVPNLQKIQNADLQPFVFFDVGKVYSKGIADSLDSATSTGMGIRFAYNNSLAATLTLAKPLTHDIAQLTPKHSRDPRIFFSITYQR